MNKIAAFACLISVILALENTSAPAADKPFLDNSSAVPIVDEANPPVGLPTSSAIRTLENNSKLFSIRCWQNGELILEEANWSTPQLADRYLALRKVGNPAPGIYLVDFDETFCELKQQ